MTRSPGTRSKLVSVVTMVRSCSEAVAALNKHEPLSFDVWGLMEWRRDEYLSEGEIRLLDGVARLHLGDGAALPALRDLYESSAQLRMPRVIGYYTRDRAGRVGPLARVDLATQGLASSGWEDQEPSEVLTA